MLHFLQESLTEQAMPLLEMAKTELRSMRLIAQPITSRGELLRRSTSLMVRLNQLQTLLAEGYRQQQERVLGAIVGQSLVGRFHQWTASGLVTVGSLRARIGLLLTDAEQLCTLAKATARTASFAGEDEDEEEEEKEEEVKQAEQAIDAAHQKVKTMMANVLSLFEAAGQVVDMVTE